MTVSRLERLISLMNVLHDSPRPLSAQELRGRVSGYPDNDASFRRQFERDKDELRELGVVLEMATVPASDPPVTGYRIDPRQLFAPMAELEADELEALSMAAAVVGFTGDSSRRAMFKLGVSATTATRRAELADDPNLETLFSAVIDRRRVRFVYRDEQREVDPYRIQFARGRWYLCGMDHGRGALRWYRVSRMSTQVSADAPGTSDPPSAPLSELTLDPWALPGDHAPMEAEVWFDPVAAAGIRDELPGADVVSEDASGLVIRLKVHNREGFRSWLLSFLDRAEVLSPPDLRDDMAKWLEGFSVDARRSS